MTKTQKVVSLNDYEHRVMIAALAKQRNELLEEDKPAEDLSDLLLKVIDAPDKKKRERDRDDER